MQRKLQKTAGFTLIELIITLAVAAILLAIAAPSFTDLIKDNRQIAQINSLSASLNLAKSEAIKRSITVTVCSSNDQSSCSGNWENGWIIFEDEDDSHTVSTKTNGDTEAIVRVQQALSNGNTLRYNRAPGTFISYSSDGFASAFQGTFTLCDDRGPSNARGLVISPSGRVRVATDTDSDGTINTGTGNMVCPS